MKNIQERGLRFFDAHVDGKYLYFSARNFNGLFRVEIGKSEAEFLGHFREEAILQKNLHRQVFCIDNYLYFIPYTGKGISIYDKANKVFSFVDVQKKEKGIVSKAYLIDRDILMIPFELSDPFILFHTHDNTCEKLSDLRNNIYMRFLKQRNVLMGLYSSCIAENKLFIKGGEGIILSIELETWQVFAHKLPKAYKIRSLYIDKKEIYLTVSDKCLVIRWNFQDDTCYEYRIDAESMEHPYMSIFRWGAHLLLLPDKKDEILELDKEKDQWLVKKEYIPDGFYREAAGSLFLGYQFVGDKLALLPWAGNGILILGEGTANLCEILYSGELFGKIKKLQEEFIKIQTLKGYVMYEDKETEGGLEQLITVLTQLMNKDSGGNDCRVAEQIWHTCRQLMNK